MHLLFIFGYIFLEIYSLMLLADVIGGLFTLVWVFAAAGIGFWLIRENGRENLHRMMMGMQQGISPQESLLNNLFILFAGVLLISPGVFSDLMALLLLIPQIRHLFFGRTMRFVQSKGQKIYSDNTAFFTFFGGAGNSAGGTGFDGFGEYNEYHDFTRQQRRHNENNHNQHTMDAEYTVREQASRKTTAVIIDSKPIDVADVSDVADVPSDTPREKPSEPNNGSPR